MSNDTSPRPERNRFAAWLKNAFATSRPMPDDSSDDGALLDRVARWVVSRKLGTPVSLFLESYKPLGYIGSQAMVMAEPLVSLTLQVFPGLSKNLSETEFRRLAFLLEHRETLDTLLSRIEQAEHESDNVSRSHEE